MADVRTTSTSTATLKNDTKGKSKSPVSKAVAEPTLDVEGNIIPYPDYDVNKELDWNTSPIARLAAAGSFTKPIPTAGEYGIQHAKEPVLDIPPECFLYDEDRPWVLGKLDKRALVYDEPAPPVELPKHVLDYLNALEQAANKVQDALKVPEDHDGVTERPAIDTAALYAKEKAAALATLPPPPKEAKAEKNPASAKDTVKKSSRPKSRNASSSPANRGARLTPITGKTSAPTSTVAASTAATRAKRHGSPRVSAQPIKPKSSAKSPGRGDAPSAKLATPSSRSSTAPKKLSNAK